MKPDTRSFYELAVRRAIARLVDGLDGAVDLTALAREAALSPLHFHHVFRGMVGETPLELHRRLRLERAATQLVTTSTSVTTIAFAAGYETHESFTRAFRRAYATSPSELRAAARDRSAGDERAACARPTPIELAAPSGVHYQGSALHFQPGATVMQATIQTMPEMTVACVPHVGPYHQIGEAFGRLGQLAGPLFGVPGAMMVGIYHDNPDAVPATELRSDAGIAVPAGTAIPPQLVQTRLPAGRYVKATHLGPYDALGDAWAALLGGWIPQHGHRIATGPSFEVYRNTPMTAKPAELVTELYVPIDD